MPSENSFTKIPKEGLPLQEFLRIDHRMFAGDPERHIKPLVDYLAQVHNSGETHGAILPGCMVVSGTGEIDLALLNSHRGHPEKLELPVYYPEGPGSDTAESIARDLKALAAVLHLIVADQPPSRRDRRLLAENPASNSWPVDFIQTIDKMLEGNSTLAELAKSLSGSPPPETPKTTAPTPEPTPELSAEEPVESNPVKLPTSEVSAVRLANAMVGREFSCEIPLPERMLGLEFQQIEALTDIPAGLVLNGKSLIGIPETSGDFDIRIRLLLLGSSGHNYATPEILLSLTINPDPRSLWKNLPSAEDDPFWKPDSAGEWLSDCPLAVVGASLRGRSHAHVGGFRDDDLAMDWIEDGPWYSLTVADGAGSSRFSRRGSQIACKTVKSHLRGSLSTPSDNPLAALVSEWVSEPNDPALKSRLSTALYTLFGQAVFEARNAIDKEAALLKSVARDFHTTLITSLVHPVANGSWFIATFSIGDGAAAVVGAPGGTPCLLTRPDGGEFAGQTVFLTMKEALATTEAVMGRISFHIVSDFKGLLLVTDGISDPRFDSDEALADPASWDLLWNEITAVLLPATNLEEASSALVDWMSFHSPGHHDDRTLILAKPSGT